MVFTIVTADHNELLRAPVTKSEIHNAISEIESDKQLDWMALV